MLAVNRQPKGDRYYNETATRYERKRLRQDWWHVEQREMQALLENLPRNLSVVDVPFGTGRFVPYYDALGYSIAGLDSSQDMLGAAKVSLGDDLFAKCTCVAGDATRLPYADEQFDLIVSTRFLRDIVLFGAARKMLREMARVTSRYAIIQLGENPHMHRTPEDGEVMGSHMSREAVDALLLDSGLHAIKRRLVKELDDGGEIYHILCVKA